MKKVVMMAMAAALMCGCEKYAENPASGSDGSVVTFRVSGDFGNPVFTRSLSADGSDMTELWVFDFVDGEVVNYIQQTAEDEDFGTPTLTMSNGEHTVCFVASRGDGCMIDDVETIMEWERPSDTFWGELTMDVSPTTHEDVAVTLGRVSTKLRVVVTDEVPDVLSQIAITPHTWFYGLDYYTGEAAVPRTDYARSVNVPESLHGTSGALSVSIFGMSGEVEWSSYVRVSAADAAGNTLSSVIITDAPFIANRQTQYSGSLFSQDGGFSLSLDDEWIEAVERQW